MKSVIFLCLFLGALNASASSYELLNPDGSLVYCGEISRLKISSEYLGYGESVAYEEPQLWASGGANVIIPESKARALLGMDLGELMTLLSTDAHLIIKYTTTTPPYDIKDLSLNKDLKNNKPTCNRKH